MIKTSMKEKKSPQANLEKERPLYFLMGFIVVLSSFFVLMEWESSPPDYSDWQNLVPVFIESEYMGVVETPEPPEEIVVEEVEPEIVYDDYEVVDEIEEIPNEIPVDSLLMEQEEQLNENQTSLQEPEEVIEDEPVYTQADVVPQFPGGTNALIRFIYQNMEYPSVALKQRIQGRVWCSFIVNKDGSVSHVKLEEGVYIFLDEEAERVLKMLPNWTPGLVNGEPVRIKVYIPIVFKL